MEYSAKTTENLAALFERCVRVHRERLQGCSAHWLAAELCIVVLLANRLDPHSAFAVLPKDVVVLIAKEVLASCNERRLWKHAIEAHCKGGERKRCTIT